MIWQHITDVLHVEMSTIVGYATARLVIAAILGGVIGLEREYKHRPAGLRTNMFICMGSCLFTILSAALSVGGDHTRIAAQIISGIGFIGAGSILRARNEFVTGLTTAATIFVVAAVGMAVGGGLYLTATFATVIALLALFVLGRTEQRLSLKLTIYTYEAVGPTTEQMTIEINQVLEPKHVLPRNVQVAPARDHVRMQFELEGSHKVQEEYLWLMRQSSVLLKVVSLGALEPE